MCLANTLLCSTLVVSSVRVNPTPRNRVMCYANTQSTQQHACSALLCAGLARAFLQCSCFQQQQISFFPTAETSSKNKLKHLFVHLYCTCLMPESYDTRMIQCDRCEHWFHFTECVGLNTKKSPSTWLCSACK